MKLLLENWRQYLNESNSLILKVAGIPLNVEVASNEESIKRGLMHREHLDPNSGMLFIFPEPSQKSFWMKDTGIPLSIAYIDEDNNLAGPMAKRFEQAIRLEGTKSNQSKHAAGVLIASEELADVCPMVYDSKNKQTIAGMEMQDLENLGVVKFDILGIAMLDKIMSISDILKNGE